VHRAVERETDQQQVGLRHQGQAFEPAPFLVGAVLQAFGFGGQAMRRCGAHGDPRVDGAVAGAHGGAVADQRTVEFLPAHVLGMQRDDLGAVGEVALGEVGDRVAVERAQEGRLDGALGGRTDES
jgi:hypothetical protein